MIPPLQGSYPARENQGRNQFPLGSQKHVKLNFPVGTQGDSGARTGTDRNGQFKVNCLRNISEPKHESTNVYGPATHVEPAKNKRPGILRGRKITPNKNAEMCFRLQHSNRPVGLVRLASLMIPAAAAAISFDPDPTVHQSELRKMIL